LVRRLAAALCALFVVAGCGDQIINEKPPVNLSRPSAEELKDVTAPDGRKLNMPAGGPMVGTAPGSRLGQQTAPGTK